MEEERKQGLFFCQERNKYCIALALTGWLLCVQLKVWLYFLVKSAADLHQEVSVVIKSKTGKNLKKLIIKSAKFQYCTKKIRERWLISNPYFKHSEPAEYCNYEKLN